MQSSRSLLGKIAGLISMMRLPNCFMIGFAVVVGELIASPFVEVRAVLNGFMTGFLLLASSMALNDYFDREIDAINEPLRPIPAGNVKPAEAVSWAIVLAAVGLLFAAYSGLWTLLIGVLSMAVMFGYNSRGKKLGLAGNAMVSANVAIPFIYGGFAVGNPTWSLGIFSLLAFLASLGREIVKGIVDVAGDRAKGVMSVAVKLGADKAARAAGISFVVAVLLSVIPIPLGLVSRLYIPLVAICDVGFLLTTYSILGNPSAQNARRNKKYVLVWMVFGLLAFLIGTV